MVKFSEYTEFSEAAVAINEALKKFHGKNVNATKKTLNNFVKDQIKNGSGEGILAVPKDAAMSKEDHVKFSLVLALIELGQEDCQLNKSLNFLQVYYDILGKSLFKGYDPKIIETDPISVQAINHHIALNQDPAYIDTIN